MNTFLEKVTAQGSLQQYVLRLCHGSHCQLPVSHCQGRWLRFFCAFSSVVRQMPG